MGPQWQNFLDNWMQNNNSNNNNDKILSNLKDNRTGGKKSNAQETNNNKQSPEWQQQQQRTWEEDDCKQDIEGWICVTGPQATIYKTNTWKCARSKRIQRILFECRRNTERKNLADTKHSSGTKANANVLKGFFKGPTKQNKTREKEQCNRKTSGFWE